MAKQKGVFERIISFIGYKDKNKTNEFRIPEPEEIKDIQEESKAKAKNKVSDDKRHSKNTLWNDKREENKADNKTISNRLDKNIEYLSEVFHAPRNKDLIIREFNIAGKHKAFVAYLDGMVDKIIINNSILKPLLLTKKIEESDDNCLADIILREILETNQTIKIEEPNKAISQILAGNTLLFIDGCNFYISNETKGFPSRPVDKPQIEGVVTGPQEAFNENIRTNISLIRKIIKNPDLTTEFMSIGKRNKSLCAIIYLDGLANPAVVGEVKRRIESLDTDFISGDGMLEQYIEDSSLSVFPTVLTTERPDRTASHIIEGKIAIILEGAPFSKIVPVTVYSMIHSPEDTYMRFPYGTLLRYIRLIGIFFAMYLPALYVAMTNFHQEMLPTDLLIAIAKAKENVPFPTIVEVLLMEASFELIREAGIRIPGIIGNTLGIIGALILGQAAVQANIVSPVLIIVVAITGLGNFSVPNFNFALTLRLIRFGFIIMGALLGFYGITVLTMILGFYLVNQKSFGVPFLAPLAPKTQKSKDLFIRYPIWKQEFRPDYVNAMDTRRQPKISRKWTQEEPRFKRDKEGDND